MLWNDQVGKNKCYSLMLAVFFKEIYFDANNKSQSGKWIPLNKDTG